MPAEATIEMATADAPGPEAQAGEREADERGAGEHEVGERAGGERDTVLSFVTPMIGLERSTRYALRPLGESWEPYASIVSRDEPNLAFMVVPPGALFDDYVIEIPEDDCAQLELDDAADTLVLVIVRRRGVTPPVVNLLAPIVANRKTLRASQVVLQESGYGLMVPVDAGTSRPAPNTHQLRPAARLEPGD